MADTTVDGRVPVIYSLRMTDAQSLFAMQDFAMRDRDVLYIATAPGVELERFIATLSTTAFSIVATVNAVLIPRLTRTTHAAGHSAGDNHRLTSRRFLSLCPACDAAACRYLLPCVAI
ncbi:MAG: hypothetical protein HRT63_11475 [Erythrobacter sp.]|nr:hypothetical protein [Erythrobacter sp.]